MKIIIACEFSGIVREAFNANGHDAWSCDLLPTEHAGQHLQADIREIDLSKFDLMIAHPPCRFLAVSGARWWSARRTEQEAAVDFVMSLRDRAPPMAAIENPIGFLSKRWRKPDQIIQPWMFGHGETKATCFWLKNLPPLHPTDLVDGRENRVHREAPSPERWKRRSRTLSGIARAMALQWGRQRRKIELVRKSW